MASGAEVVSTAYGYEPDSCFGARDSVDISLGAFEPFADGKNRIRLMPFTGCRLKTATGLNSTPLSARRLSSENIPTPKA